VIDPRLQQSPGVRHQPLQSLDLGVAQQPRPLHHHRNGHPLAPIQAGADQSVRVHLVFLAGDVGVNQPGSGELLDSQQPLQDALPFGRDFLFAQPAPQRSALLPQRRFLFADL